jgi:putative transposase
VLRCDNGPELPAPRRPSRPANAPACTGLHFIPSGQPWRNGYDESFNSRVRDECLNVNMFWSLGRHAW